MKECPISTKDIKLNLKNRDWAFKNVGYGPANPEGDDLEFWGKRADEWNTSVDQAKEMKCGNCAAFIQTPEMMDCIVLGLGEGTKDDEYYAIVDAADLGYCELFEFKCAADRTCSAWLVGGPIKKVMTAKQRNMLAMAKQEYEMKEKAYEDMKESFEGDD